MKNFTLKYICILLCLLSMRAPQDPLEAEIWYETMDQRLTKVIELPNSEAKIDKLGEYLFKFGSRLPHPDERWNATFTKAKDAALAFPNHSQHFRQRIEAMFDPTTGKFNQDMGLERRTLIAQTLGHVPSPEIVQLLGELLADERGKQPFSVSKGTASSNAEYACGSLNLLKLRHPPVVRDEREFAWNISHEHIDTWKLWWEQVKAGNRTFSFEGQDVEYRLRKDGSYETVTRAEAKRRSSGAATIDETKESIISKTSQRWLIFLVGLAALFAWLWWKKKKSAV